LREAPADECLPLDFRHSFPHHDAQTAEWAGLPICRVRRLVDRRSGNISPKKLSRILDLDYSYPRANQSARRLVLLADVVLRALETIEPGQTSEVPLAL
jgi:hypothetical protein